MSIIMETYLSFVGLLALVLVIVGVAVIIYMDD